MRKVFQISGIIVIMISIAACGKQTQAETVPPSTGIETTVEETTTVAPTLEKSIVEEIAEKVDLPTLSTGREWDEVNAMAYESLYNNWVNSLDEEMRNYLGESGLSGMLETSFTDFTEQECLEVKDYLLSKAPITQKSTMENVKEIEKEVQQQGEETQASQQQQQSKPKETQASQPTQPQQTQPQVFEEVLTPEEQKMQEEWEQIEEELKNRKIHQDLTPIEGHAAEPVGGDWSHVHIGGH